MSNEKYANTLSQMSEEQLRAELKKCLKLTADNLERVAYIVAELERRGLESPILNSGMCVYLRAIKAGKLHPAAVVELAECKTVINALCSLPRALQAEIVAKRSIALKRKDGTVEYVPLARLSSAEINQAFDQIGGKLIAPEAQIVPKPRASSKGSREDRKNRLVIMLNDQEYAAAIRNIKRSGKSVQAYMLTLMRDDMLFRE